MLPNLAPPRTLFSRIGTLRDVLRDILALTRPFKPFTPCWSTQLVLVPKLIHLGHPRHLIRSYLSYALLLGTMVHFIGLLLWPSSNVSRLDHVLRFDLFRVLGLSRTVIVEACGAVTSTIYFHYYHCSRLYAIAEVYQWMCVLGSGRCERENKVHVDACGRIRPRLLAGMKMAWTVFCAFLFLAGKLTF